VLALIRSEDANQTLDARKPSLMLADNAASLQGISAIHAGGGVFKGQATRAGFAKGRAST